jgi:pimeloyl-ACP methyl ester carboxylesterase
MRAANTLKGERLSWRGMAAIVLPLLGVVWLVQGAWMIRKAARPRHEVEIDQGSCHTPATVLEPDATGRSGAAGPDGVPAREGADSAIVLHGLAANRRLMMYLGDYLAMAGVRVYLLDLAGHGDNIDSFSFARAAECATETVERLAQSGKIDLSRTVLVGHSMGGAIAVRMTDREPVAATIAISPGPMILPKRMPSNLLVFSAQFDPPQLRRETVELAQAAGGERGAPEDFIQRRAFESQMVPHATHTSLLHAPEVIEKSVSWVVASLYADAPPAQQEAWLSAYWMNVRSHPPTPVLLGTISGALGLIAVFPLMATIVVRGWGALSSETEDGAASGENGPARPRWPLVLAEGGACAVAAALLLGLGVPLKFLHLYQGDYFVSLLAIAAALLLALNWRRVRYEQRGGPHWRALAAAATLGFTTFLAVSAWFNWQITDLWLNAARWERFAELLPAACIFCFAEEFLLGSVREGWKRARRFTLALALRLEFWLACALAYYALTSGQVLILLLIAYFAAVSIFQRLATDALRRRTGSLTAAALFNAILAAWFIAAVFPLT